MITYIHTYIHKQYSLKILVNSDHECLLIITALHEPRQLTPLLRMYVFMHVLHVYIDRY